MCRLFLMQSRKQFTLDPEFVDTETGRLTIDDLEQFLTEWEDCNSELVSVTVALDDSCYVHS